MSGPAFRARLETTRSAPRRGIDRVRAHRFEILQTALAAGIAWELALLVLPAPFFAPIAAVITLGVSRGQHVRRAFELGFGVALGIGIGDVLIRLLGTNGLLIGVIVALAISGAVMVSASQLLVNQAAISAVLLVTLGTPAGVGEFDRFFAALVGGGVALVIGPVLFSRDPLKRIGEEAERLLDRMADVIVAVADALRDGDEAAADAALALARGTDTEVAAYEEAISTARESLRLYRRGKLPRLDVYAEAAEQVDYAVRNTRVLARTAQTAVVRGVPADAELVHAVRLLADAIRTLAVDLRAPDEPSEARNLARQAAAEATAVLDRRSDLSSNVLISTVRSTAADILRGTGMDTQEMRVVLGPYPGGRTGPEAGEGPP